MRAYSRKKIVQIYKYFFIYASVCAQKALAKVLFALLYTKSVNFSTFHSSYSRVQLDAYAGFNIYNTEPMISFPIVFFDVPITAKTLKLFSFSLFYLLMSKISCIFAP